MDTAPPTAISIESFSLLAAVDDVGVASRDVERIAEQQQRYRRSGDDYDGTVTNGELISTISGGFLPRPSSHLHRSTTMVHVSRSSLFVAVGAVLSLVACEAVDIGDAAAAEQGLVADANDTADADAVDEAHQQPRHRGRGFGPGFCRPPLAADVEARLEARGPPPHGARPHRRWHGADGGPLLAVYDDNDDGSLDDAERAALRADADAGCAIKNAEIIDAFDADGDKVLSVGEFTALRASHDEQHRADHAARARGPLDDDAVVTATWDLDNDGVLSATEKVALRKTLRTLVREGLRLPRLHTLTTKLASAARETP